MAESAAFLLVTAGGRAVGLPIEYLVGVSDIGTTHAVPSPEPAMRGVASVGGETMPVVHLGALLGGHAFPDVAERVGVVIAVGDVRLCLEVDAADVVVREPVLPLPPASTLPWARGVVRRADGLVPLLDLSALGARLAEAGTNSCTAATTFRL